MSIDFDDIHKRAITEVYEKILKEAEERGDIDPLALFIGFYDELYGERKKTDSTGESDEYLRKVVERGIP